MKYSDAQELAKGLRDLADFIEKKGVKLPAFRYLYDDKIRFSDYLFGDNAKNNMRDAAKLLAPCEKKWTKNNLDLRKKFGKFVTLELTTQKANICEKKLVNTIEHPAETVEAWTEEVYEYECTESILA